jgi:general secretion pathway protein B
VPAFAELPESTRRALPPLKLGGSMYSEQPAARMLIVNSVVYHEGDTLAPGLKLESIGLRKARLSYQGQSFTLDY